MSSIIKNVNFYHVILLVTFFYILFPTNNSSLDAYGYAGYIEYGNALFSPHHLLYNAFIYTTLQPLKLIFPTLNVLYVSKVINSLFLVLNLYILATILKKLYVKKNEIIFFILIAGFSFNSWRFGTENETYIIPITFSLLASLYFLKYLQSKKSIYIFFSGLFSTIACLFHQIHFLWWLGLFIGLLLAIKRFKVLITYSVSSLLVPLIYTLVIVFYNNQQLTIDNFIYFIFHDYYSGVATSEFGWKNFFLIGVSTVRTFFQVHVSFMLLLKKSSLFFLPALFFAYFLLFTIKKAFKRTLYKKREGFNKAFLNTHTIILLLHFAFAFYAVGNVEFLVMIPFLVLLSVFYKFQFKQRFLGWFSVTLFIWNFSFGIFPNNQYKYSNDDVLVSFIAQHPNDVFIVKEPALVNMYFYKTGVDNYSNILLYDDITPLDLKKIKSDFIYTDIIDKPKIFTRATIISKDNSKLNLKSFKKEVSFTYEGLYGKTSVYKVFLK